MLTVGLAILAIVILVVVGAALYAIADYQLSATRCSNPHLFGRDQIEMFTWTSRQQAPKPAPRAAVIRAPAPEMPTIPLFLAVRQHHRPTTQADSVYAAIVKLRKGGHTVEPRGHEHHAIDGEQIDWRELIRRAEALS